MRALEHFETVYNKIDGEAYRLGLSKPEVPEYIKNNLKHEFFYWQKEAFEKFLTFHKVKEKSPSDQPIHLMFNMATGSGKTLLMAATILYYYKQGYKHFIFFVNQNNIVGKTENNFINSTHNKYLFKDKIVIDDKTISIKKLEMLSDDPQGIEIKFTTIQKLYNDIFIERENQTTLDDLHNKDIIMLADEAHHLNAKTKKQIEMNISALRGNTSKEEVERKGWEYTVIELLLKKNGKTQENKNALLEFTATIPDNKQVIEKYRDKIIYQFELKDFLQAGYTKEINLISSTLNKKERVLQALLFTWYRHKMALKNNIANFKPVILFRSKTIEESKRDYQIFLDWVENIQAGDFDFLKNIISQIDKAKHSHLNINPEMTRAMEKRALKLTINEMGKSRTQQVLSFIERENINYLEIANFIKTHFTETNVLITNSETNKAQREKTTEDQEKLLNSLEDKHNHIRAIFTVQRLTEGWDVLNLFDIVRLYEGQNTGGGYRKTPEATVKEKQLIGRGVRYFPFDYPEKIKNQRKFDNDLNHDLRVLEELYYYTYDEDSQYISHLKEELRQDGYIQDDKTIKLFALKKEFQKSDFYKNTKVWYNKRINNPNRKKKTLEGMKDYFSFSYNIQGLEMSEQAIDFKKQDDQQRLHLKETSFKTIHIKFKDIENHIFRKAINVKSKQEGSLFQFAKLSAELDIKSTDDLQLEQFLGDFSMKIKTATRDWNDISNDQKLNITLNFLDKFFREFKKMIIPKIGSDFMSNDFKRFFSSPKTKSIKSNNEYPSILGNKWYILNHFVGTKEERDLIDFIKSTIDNLNQKYEEIYLLKNEEVYKIYDFKKGRCFQPDFILFLKSKDTKELKKDSFKMKIYYQIFIESKGRHLIEHDQWKDDFLDEISKKYGFKNIIRAENPNYRLIGLPFFNQGNERIRKKFEDEFNKLI